LGITVGGVPAEDIEMVRVVPTGKCFCGCGEPTEATSYFVSGHDRRAEAKVVKEVYGSLVEFVVAHGYGPEGRDPAAAIRDDTDRRGLQLLEEWSKEQSSTGNHAHVVLEVLNMEDRGGPRQRFERFHVEFSPGNRAFRFDRCRSGQAGETRMELTVPLPDVGWVYIERNPQDRRADPARIVRLRGGITVEPIPRFLPFG
jgi:hypothetical protein